MTNYITKREEEFEKLLTGTCASKCWEWWQDNVLPFHRQSLFGLIEEIEQWAKKQEGDQINFLSYLEELKK